MAHHNGETASKLSIKDMHDKDIDFIVGHFREGTMSPENNWRIFRETVGLRRRHKWVAAAIVAMIVVSASAAIFTYRGSRMQTVEIKTEIEQPIEVAPVEAEYKLMVFEATRLSDVVESIEEEYGVKIGNIPSKADDYVLTLRYEGTAEELVDAINEILGTQLTVEEP